ncbi:MAG: Nif3-like dinuclear metal center hexameric protein [Chitinophagaceae bacterium]|nr:Nif3-like dinuclear metal center hexameric protein [Chitinophagaceae bacterium]
MKIKDIIEFLEQLAPLPMQEHYDNSGLITGKPDKDCTGILCCLDATEEVVDEALKKNCNVVISHHPVIFAGLKKITGRNTFERALIKAIKNDLAMYGIHTNLDNVIDGVNGEMATRLSLTRLEVLEPKQGMLKKIYTYVPKEYASQVLEALFAAGGGHIGNYSECSFSTEGIGTFRAGQGANPFIGEIGIRHYENEVKVEVIFPFYLENKIMSALREAHPYEEVAYEIMALSNTMKEAGAGLIGDLPEEMTEKDFLHKLKEVFKTPVIKHSPLSGKKVKKVALCGGAGNFLISTALSKGADVLVTSEVKYYQYFEADGKMLLCDIGHFESEQFTMDLIIEKLRKKFTTFAVLKTENYTNPVHYF